MHEMSCSAGQNVSRKMDGVGLLRDCFRTRSVRGGSCLDRPHSGNASSGLVFIS